MTINTFISVDNAPETLVEDVNFHRPSDVGCVVQESEGCAEVWCHGCRELTAATVSMSNTLVQYRQAFAFPYFV